MERFWVGRSWEGLLEMCGFEGSRLERRELFVSSSSSLSSLVTPRTPFQRDAEMQIFTRANCYSCALSPSQIPPPFLAFLLDHDATIRHRPSPSTQPCQVLSPPRASPRSSTTFCFGSSGFPRHTRRAANPSSSSREFSLSPSPFLSLLRLPFESLPSPLDSNPDRLCSSLHSFLPVAANHTLPIDEHHLSTLLPSWHSLLVPYVGGTVFLYDWSTV